MPLSYSSTSITHSRHTQLLTHNFCRLTYTQCMLSLQRPPTHNYIPPLTHTQEPKCVIPYSHLPRVTSSSSSFTHTVPHSPTTHTLPNPSMWPRPPARGPEKAQFCHHPSSPLGGILNFECSETQENMVCSLHLTFTPTIHLKA